MSKGVNQIPGQIPPFWNRSVAFFANILSLFYGNISETEVLKKEVGALETYGSRLIPLINLMFHGKKNVLLLEVPPDNQLIEYFRQDLELTLPQVRVVPFDVYKTFSEKKDHYSGRSQELIDWLRQIDVDCLDGYIVDDALVNLAQLLGKKTVGTKKGCRNGNNKLLLHQFLKTTKFNVFDSYETDSVADIKKCMRDFKAKGYHHVVVKAPIGASGIGMQKLSLDEPFDDLTIPEYLLFEGKVLVQGWLDETVEGVRYIGSPSIQLFVDEQRVHLYDLTDQILSPDSIHEGNVAPPVFLTGGCDCRQELFDQAAVAGQWLYDQGYRGTGSIDFHVIVHNKRTEVRICEINARVTGATYPAILARTFLPKGAWLMRNIRFDPSYETDNLLDVLDRQELLFRPGMSGGILPFNFNPNEAGKIVKGQFLFLGPGVNDVFSLLKRLQEIETIKGVYDRD
ncbi:MAG: hypothetical protein AB7S78_10045 [Candidatus Omnitrophota bacterium]